MKKVLLILLVLALLFGGMITAIVVGVFSLTSGLPESAEAFFTEARRGDMAKARDYLAEEFKKSTDDAALQAFLADNGLLKYKDASWSSRSIKNNVGRLKGEVTTDDGGVIPLEIEFVQEQDRWKIYAMRKAGAGVPDEDAPAPATAVESTDGVPSQAEARALLEQALHDFAVSAQQKSMRHFFGTTSKMWQGQMTVEQLDAAFKAVMDYGFDLTALDTMDPVVTRVERDAEGALVVEGRYDASQKVYLELRYVLEDDAWKLLAFNINIKP